MADRKHTPAPFVGEVGGKRGAWIKGANGNWLCLSCGETDQEAEANTAFIVRACNAHDDLVAALKQCRSELASLHHGDCDMDHAERHCAGLKLANAALKLAGALP